MDNFTDEELGEALKEVSSTISKCEKIQGKFAEGIAHHRRFDNLIKAMEIAKALLDPLLTWDSDVQMICKI